MTELFMLGNPILCINDKPLAFRDKKGLGLIAYLAVNGETNRDKLADLLWSDLGQTDARRNLRQRLYELKTKIPSQILSTQGDMVRLETPIKTDLSWYQTQLESGDFEAAVQLWRGAFLDALEIPGADGFSEWLENTRTELSASYHEALRQVASTREANGDLRGALEAHKRLLQDDELQEFHQREVMRLLELLGENETALLQFERFSQTLDQELGDTPLPETRAIAQRLRHANTRGLTPILAASPTLNLHAPLIGRESTWQKIKAKTDVLHLILGEPGIGKSRLASEFAQDHSPTITLRGREGSSGSALYPVAEALRQTLIRPDWLDNLEPIWKAECARLIPEFDLEHATHAPPANLEGRVRFLEGLSRALLASLETTGTIVLDDLQWFDPLSLEFVGHLTRRALESGVRLIATARPQELSQNEAAAPILNDLKRDTMLETHQLKALKERDVRGMIQALTGGNDAPRFAQRLHHATTGNPFFMLETLRDLFSAGELQVMATGGWHTAYDADTETYNELRIPTTVRETVIARVDRAGAATRRLLEAASLAGDGFDLNLIASATALNEWEGLEGIERAVQAELLETHPNGYKFNHDLTRRALEDGLSLDRRKLLHRKLAVSLATQNGMPERIAVHFEEGGQPREAAPWRVKAGEAATKVYAYELALEHYGKAIEDGLEDREAFEIHAARSQLFRMLDNHQGWKASIDAMISLSQELKIDDLYLQTEVECAEFERNAGQYTQAIERIDNALAQLSKQHDGSKKAKAQFVASQALQSLGRNSEIESRLLESLPYAKVGNPHDYGLIHIALSNFYLDLGQLDKASDHNRSAVEFFSLCNNYIGLIRSMLVDAEILKQRGRYSEAANHFEKALNEAKISSLVRFQKGILLDFTGFLLSREDGQAALNQLEKGLKITPQLQDLPFERRYFIELAHAYKLNGNFKDAFISIRKAIELNKKLEDSAYSIWSYFFLAELNREIGYFYESEKDLENARLLIEKTCLNEYNFDYEIHCAKLATVNGNAGYAIGLFKNTLSNVQNCLPEDFTDAYLGLSEAYLELKNPNMALKTVPDKIDIPSHVARALRIKILSEDMLGNSNIQELKNANDLIENTKIPALQRLCLADSILKISLKHKKLAKINKITQIRNQLNSQIFNILIK